MKQLTPAELLARTSQGTIDMDMPNLTAYLKIRQQGADATFIAVPRYLNPLLTKPHCRGSIAGKGFSSFAEMRHHLNQGAAITVFAVFPDSTTGALIGLSKLRSLLNDKQCKQLQLVYTGRSDHLAKSLSKEQEMPRLTAKVALITGAARGIGAAIAKAYIAEGAVVYLSDLDVASGQQLAAQLGEDAYFLPLDVRDELAWQQVTATILDRAGKLDILVNNAGITGFENSSAAQDPEHATLAAWRDVHATNLDGVFLGCKYGIRAMRAHGRGAIINMSSRSGIVGIPGAAAYASSKAAVRNHTKTVALYCAEQGLTIRCNSIHPAAILTPMWDPLLGEGAERKANMALYVQDTPLRRFGTPEEVAAVAVLLASDECGYLTGAEINIDGGILAGSAASPTQ